MRFLMLVLVLCGISFSGEYWDYSYSPPRKIQQLEYQSDTTKEIKHSPLYSPEESWEKQRKNNPNFDSDMKLKEMQRQSKAQEQFSEDYHTNSIIGRTLLGISIVSFVTVLFLM